MSNKDKEKLIIATIEGEEHLGENLKKILIEYVKQIGGGSNE